MAVRTLFQAVGRALVGGFIMGAGQLGILYGLNIVDWDHVPTNDDTWSANLTWTAWVGIVGVLAGAAAGIDQVRRTRGAEGMGLRIAVGLAAAVGAAAVAPLVWLPARAAHPSSPVDPGLVGGLTAVAAVVVGLLFAIAMLSSGPVAANIGAFVAWVSIAAVASVVWSVWAGDDPALPRVGLFGHGTATHAGSAYGTVVPLAVVVAVLVALVSRGAGRGRVAVALSGAAGPGLMAAAYLLAGPGASGAQHTGYGAGLASAAAALAASILTALMTGTSRAAKAVSTSDSFGSPEPRAAIAPGEPSG